MHSRDCGITGSYVQRFVTIVALTAAVACAARPELLNSERIERRYGSYGVVVLQADAESRTSSLYSNEASGRICRTLAIVEFMLPVDDRLAKAHRKVVAGGSIGATFRDAGWRIEKSTLLLGEMRADDAFEGTAGLMQIGAGASLATHRYRFDVIKGPVRIPYAVITEIHHPDYLRLEQLRAMYGTR
jgi:hypothetical protein